MTPGARVLEQLMRKVKSTSKGKGTSGVKETVKIDANELMSKLNQIVNKRVLVGIPQEKDGRDDGSKMGNAARAYILNYGSRAAHIPAREFMISGIESELDKIRKQYKTVIQAALKFDYAGIDKGLKGVGLLAQNGIKKRIASNLPPPLSPFTVAWRYKDRTGGKMRKSEKNYGKFIAQGYGAHFAQELTGIRSLVNTGEMMRHITYVIRIK